MKKNVPWSGVIPMFCIGFGIVQSEAAVTVLNSAAEITDGVQINFDGYADNTVANLLYGPSGMTFSRDDGFNIYLVNWAHLERTTTSPDHVLATVRTDEPTFATHLNLIPSGPLSAAGAYFGNDQNGADFSTIRMSAFDHSGELIGFTEVAVNNNMSVDQFIGLRSDVPFVHVRFENFDSAGLPSKDLSVVLDDLVFTPVPEPSSLSLFAAGVFGFALKRRAGTWREG